MTRAIEKFTEDARRVLALGQNEARRLEHNHIGTEHLLLGLAGEREGGAGCRGPATGRAGPWRWRRRS